MIMEPVDNLMIFESRSQKIVALLDRHLATAIDLRLRVMQAVWNVDNQTLTDSRDLGRTASEIEQFCGRIVARLKELGACASAGLEKAQARSCLEPYPSVIDGDEGYINAIHRGLTKFRRFTKEAREKADALYDETTAKLFSDQASAIDTQIWFLRSPVR
jgi:DNA-binding ferritin-like protein